jgi:hypothetical protein
MSSWNYIVLGLSLLLLIYLFRKEIIRADKRFLLLRIVLSFLATGFLAFLGLEKSDSGESGQHQDAVVALITKGYQQDSVNDFLRTRKGTTVYTMGDYVGAATRVSDPGFLAQQGSVKAVHIFGWGLNKNELLSLGNIPVIFHPSPIPSGIRSISWIQTLRPGEELRVQGSYKNSTGSAVKLVLNGFNTSFDSTVIQPATETGFVLKQQPRHLGRAVYSLFAIQGHDTITKESIPLEIKPAGPMKVLMLSSSPDFDNRFLKNWLSENGYEVVTRTLISKNKFSREFLNSELNTLGSIGDELLKNFDVLIADRAALAMLGRQDLRSIEENISAKGMGMIVKADSLPPGSFYASRFALHHSGNQSREMVKLQLGDSSSLSPLPVQEAVYIQPMAGSMPLIKDAKTRIFANTALYGKGKIILTTLPNSYSWVLAGKQSEYHSFWSVLLNQAAKKIAVAETWNIMPGIAYVNKPLTLELQTAAAGIPTGTIGGASVYLQQDEALAFKWSGNYWAQKPGWQGGISMQGNPYYWYAYGGDDWHTVIAASNVLETKQYSIKYPYHTISSAERPAAQDAEVPEIYFLIAFVLCCAALWIRIKGLGA